MDIQQARFLKVCRGEKVDATPIWLMRQAGRYMSEYRDLRSRYGILDIIHNDDLACEVTMQPIKRFDLDAAIIFADLLPPIATLGLHLEYVKGEGPFIHNPIRTMGDIDRLHWQEPEESMPATMKAIKTLVKELAGRNIPLIGFAGAPFTLASYAIEGMGGTNRITLKRFMYEQPEAWERLMLLFSELSGKYLLAQANAGAHALQLFDSWVGELSPADYRKYVMPYSKKTIEIAKQAGVPVIHFGTGTAGLLLDMQHCGGDVLGIDWRIDLHQARNLVGSDTVIQGNLDPATLFAPKDIITKAAQGILDQVGVQGRHIFNVGHGIMPHTPVEHVEHLIDIVHSYSERYHDVT